jgi:predicted negative regulator of RcsB-dependent stress response
VAPVHEDEQVEKLKQWWKDNGTSTLIGISLGIAVIFGWRGWQVYQQNQAEEASSLYHRTFTQFQQEQPQKAREAANRLLTEYSGSSYAAMGSLMLAKQAAEDKQWDAALAHLDWIINNGDVPELLAIARLRKARLLLLQDKIDEALTLAESDVSEAFKPHYNALKGDVYLRQGDKEKAREAYTQAVTGDTMSAQQRQWVQLKLDNISTPEDVVTTPVSETDQQMIASKLASVDALATPTTSSETQ